MKPFIIKTVSYGALLLLLNLGLGAFLKSYEEADLKENGIFFPAMRWEEYYQLPDPIDVLILGSSHAFRAYDPQVIARKLDPYDLVFNFGSAAQSPVTSFFVLREVMAKHRPRIVVMDIYPVVFNYDDQMKNGRYNLEQMKWSRNKIDFFLKGFSFREQVALLFFPTLVYKDHLKPKLKKLLGLNYLPLREGRYLGKGFAGRPDTLSLSKLISNNQFDHFRIDKSQVTARNVEYLNKIRKQCEEAGVPIVFMSAPIPRISVEKIKSYESTFQFFLDLATDMDVPYYDFNIHRIPAIKDEEHFFDDDHMNMAGAALFSESVAGILKSHLKYLPQ